MKPSTLLLSLSASMPLFFDGGPRGRASVVSLVRSFSYRLPTPLRGRDVGVVVGEGGSDPLLRRRRRRRRRDGGEAASTSDDDAATTSKSPYAINDELCPPTDPNHLRKIVRKHCATLDAYLSYRPIAAHTLRAFESISSRVDPCGGIVLDSGCGTGRSTLLLGQTYPDSTAIGVDRSFVRLNRNVGVSNEAVGVGANDEADDDGRDDDDDICRRPFIAAASSNALLVRAELTDFWRCCLNAGWKIERHYVLYPNPYPKKNRLKKRFYAHPSFPLLLALGGREIVVRSNWEGYLREFAASVGYADEYYREVEEGKRRRREDGAAGATTQNWAGPYAESASSGPVERIDKTIAWTNFEKKYDDVGEPTYELLLRRRETTDT